MLDPLIVRARSGDAAALEELLAELAPSLHRFGLRMCKDADDAEDVLQDALISVAQHLPEFEGRSSLSSWAFTLARTACARRRRGKKNQPLERADDVAEPVATEPTPEDRASEQELGRLVSSALDALSDDHREVLVLRDVEGLTAPEVADVLGVSIDAVKSRLHRAREALREKLRASGLEPRAATPPKPTCPDVVALWSKKLEGDLRPEDCAEMEKHVEGCVSCGSACDALKSALGACRRAATPDVSPAVRAQILRALDAWKRETKLAR